MGKKAKKNFEEAPDEEKVKAEGEAEGESEATPEKEPEAKKAKAKVKEPTAEEKIAELSDRITRSMAEFDNFRKRSEKEKAARFEMGQKSVIEKLLPIIDNFERGLATLEDGQKDEPFAQGMDKTYKQMLSLLEELGVTVIPAVGEKFNPEVHEAIMHIEDEAYGENEIVEELQKGYKMGETVVRFSMVKVAN